MNIKQAKYHLKRIQTILDLQDGTLTELDRNILLEDIKKLYELIIFTGGSSSVSPEKSAEKEISKSSAVLPATAPEIDETPASPIGKTVTPSPAPEKPEIKTEEKELRPVSEEIPATPKEKPAPAPSYSSVPSEPTPDTAYNPPQPSVADVPAEQPIAQASPSPAEHSPSNGRQSETAVLTHENEHQYPELFDFHSTDELSEKLGNSKVDQLNRILAINDKILYINHLFGGEAIPFQDSLKKFESFYTYEEAKSYASQELVEKYQWTDQNRRDTVRQFMKQVRRLY